MPTCRCSQRVHDMNMAARQLSVVRELTECSICTEEFTDPRVLPCQHTFCLKCLLNYGKDRRPEYRMPCPLCRQEFTIPVDGLSGIRKNFDMEKLVSARKPSAREEAGQKKGNSIPCDVCSNEAALSASPASKYCSQCEQNYCDQCSQNHTKIKATARHVLMPIDLCSQVKSDGDMISELLKMTEGVLPRLAKEKNDLISRLADIEREINTAADKLIATVERDRVKLLSEVESIKLKRLKQLEMVKQEVEQHMAALVSLQQYSETLLSSGTACDVTRSANSLHSRAEELMMFDVIGHVDNSLPSMNLNFTASTRLGVDNLVGSVTEEGL